MPEIIAEVGVNHNGSLERAFDFIEEAKTAGADVCKFQTFQILKLLRPGDTSYDLFRRLELPFSAFRKIADHCAAVGIEFMSTPGDVECLRFLVDECKVKRLKIGSDDLTNKPLIDAAIRTKLPLIISTGMATLREIFSVGHHSLNHQPTYLHCVSLYPCPPELANLQAIKTMQADFFNVGYSDHTGTALACIMAATLGASIIEAHMMLDEDCVDAKVSLSVEEFTRMVQCVRKTELMLGNGIKEPGQEEIKAARLLRKGPDGLRGAT